MPLVRRLQTFLLVPVSPTFLQPVPPLLCVPTSPILFLRLVWCDGRTADIRKRLIEKTPSGSQDELRVSQTAIVVLPFDVFLNSWPPSLPPSLPPIPPGECPEDIVNTAQCVDGLSLVDLAIHIPGPGGDDYEYNDGIMPLWKGAYTIACMYTAVG